MVNSRSLKRDKLRIQSIPNEITLPAELPISRHASEIEGLLARNQVIIVAGDTGSGKTTQLPKICLRAGLGRRGMIGHTQPRRLAAMSVAARISEELNADAAMGVCGGRREYVPVGFGLGVLPRTPAAHPHRGVGVQVRFDQRVPEDAWLKLMTDGILLAEIQRDRLLKKYQALILDEAHERSLNIDFLLGYLKLILPRRKDLRLIVTSATLDVDRIAAHFNQAPIVRVAGRSYPVKTLYRPPEQLVPDADEEDRQMAAIAQAISELNGHGEGDILIFLSSEKEIRETAAFLRKRRMPNTEVLPLYSRLRATEQQRIFAPHGGRRIVLSTNVAETSLTVPGIHFVIDTGFARISRYSVQRKLLRLPIEPVSRASAEQRKGRCGRLADGVCIRLYGEEDFQSRPDFTDPEIKRSNLASVILRMSALQLGRPEEFPFLDAPEQKSINDGRRLLRELGALTESGALTRTGRMLAELPLEPQLGRMLVAASEAGSLREVLIIVSAMSLGDLRDSAPGGRIDDKWAEFIHPESDFLGLLTLWDRCENERVSQSQLRKFCARYRLSFQRVREWREIHRQLLNACRRLGAGLNRKQAGYAEIHRALVSGSLNQVARHHDGRTYLGSRNRKLTLAPSSALARKNKRWIVTSEWIDTARTFASMAAVIKPEWVIEYAGHLLRKEYGEPFWSADRQQVMAHEKTVLYGLALRDMIPVDYARFDTAGARDIFLDQALVEDLIRSKADFLKKNRRFLDELRKQEEKFRRPELVVNEREIQRFYDQRLPESVVSTRTLECWLAEDPAVRNRSLDMEQAGLFRGETLAELQRQFPDQIKVQSNVLPVDYVFDPGSSRDGASLRVPAELVAQLSAADLDWAIPGLVREKCIALIRGLPKSKRRKFIPVPDFVDSVLPGMQRSDGELADSLLSQMNRAGGNRVERRELVAVVLPGHLRTMLQVVDPKGRVMAEGDDLAALRERFAGSAPVVRHQRHTLERSGLQDWDFEYLPEQVQIGSDVVLLRYPALVDEISSVSVKLLDNRQEAETQSRQGAMRLFMLRTVARKNALRKRFLRFRNANAARIFFMSGLGEVEKDAIITCYLESFSLNEELPRNRQEFTERLERNAPRLPVLADELEQLLTLMLEQTHEIRRRLADLSTGSGQYVRADIQGQLERMFPENFLQDTAFEWLRQFPRYLDGIRLRLEKAPFFGPADEKSTREVAYYWDRYEQLHSTRGASRLIQTLRWSIEEFRVSLFAQRLGTSLPISKERLDKQFAELTD